MNKKIMLMVGLLALPLSTVALNSNPEPAQAKIHYVHTPKALRGHYHGMLTKEHWNGKTYYSGETIVVTKKYISTGMLQSDTYPDRPVKVKTLKKYTNGKLYKIKLKDCIGKGYTTDYIAHFKEDGHYYIILGYSYKQFKKNVKSGNGTFVHAKVPGIGYNYI
ncbi:hypothetical protein [Levilactobacillus humaensis]|uniref:hypothetical protein n=1 Tax=Levilactobacillus humaensis TaxID=2950375 RepID=UPI0021C2AE2E|nr:hypothetical protein [Levilactobacillus humaensis]